MERTQGFKDAWEISFVFEADDRCMMTFERWTACERWIVCFGETTLCPWASLSVSSGLWTCCGLSGIWVISEITSDKWSWHRIAFKSCIFARHNGKFEIRFLGCGQGTLLLQPLSHSAPKWSVLRELRSWSGIALGNGSGRKFRCSPEVLRGGVWVQPRELMWSRLRLARALWVGLMNA